MTLPIQNDSSAKGDIEVTPEMVSAGVSVVRPELEDALVDPYYHVDQQVLVTKLYIAMERARRQLG